MRVADMRSLLAVLTSSLAAATDAAEDFPTRPIRMVVPFAAGGGTDIAARLLGEGLTQSPGHTVVVDNRGGAGSTIGTDLVTKSPHVRSCEKRGQRLG